VPLPGGNSTHGPLAEHLSRAAKLLLLLQQHAEQQQGPGVEACGILLLLPLVLVLLVHLVLASGRVRMQGLLES
jgi:hypothetical protein